MQPDAVDGRKAMVKGLRIVDVLFDGGVHALLLLTLHGGSAAALIVRAAHRSEGQTRTSRVEVGQPAQGPQSGCKEIFTAARDNKLRQISQAATDRLCRDRELTGLASLPGYWVAFALRAEEAAVIHPLGLHELELPTQIRSGEDERQSPIDTVIFQDSRRKQRTNSA